MPNLHKKSWMVSIYLCKWFLRLTKRKAYFRMNLWNHSEIYWPLWHPCLVNHIGKLNTSPVRICQHEVIFFGSSLTNCGAEVNGIYLSDIFPLCFQEKVKNPLPRFWTKVILYKSLDDLFLSLFVWHLGYSFMSLAFLVQYTHYVL